MMSSPKINAISLEKKLT
ncbi:hypothetical protein F383_23179 [Gossypium arboreum]|uniref:Uncharacterized protein n=1 Tax=Gossypium arboreum TaxID=29729 RepID=A0A0B0NUM0_GOSAR|nr:hypothetical protein F383_23179 [Gossypium arboreum]